MTEEHKKIIEINGVKMEVDMRHATQVHDNIKIGSRVKVLDKEYSDYKVHHGVVVAFDQFEELPTITVLALVQSYSGTEMKFYHINNISKTEIVPATDWLPEAQKASVVEKLDSEVKKKEIEIEDLKSKKEFFLQQYGSFIKPVEA